MLEPAFGEAVVDAVVGAPAWDADELVEQPAAATIAATRRWRGHRRARLFCVRLGIGTERRSYGPSGRPPAPLTIRW